MRLTSKGRYAVRAMLDLTERGNGGPVRLQEISTRQKISLHYLEQLFRKLRNGQAVRSVRGPGGGYVLARSMDEISIKDVLDCVGENTDPAKDIVGPDNGQSLTIEFNLLRSYFENLGKIMQEYLSTTTLGDLNRKAKTLAAEGSQINDQQATSSISTTSSIGSAVEDVSPIRPSIGEINQ